MPAERRAVARPMSGGGSGATRTAALLVITFTMLIALTLGAVSAQPPPQVARLTPEEARNAGVALALAARPDLAPALVEVRSGVGREAAPGADLLAVADGGAMAALAERRGLDPATLALVWADGSQLRIAMPGLLGARFAPDGSWIAAVDGAGALWQLATDDGDGQIVSDGPFLGPLAVESDGSILALAVASVEAPFVSHLVRVDTADGSVTQLGDDELVYDVQRLQDSSLAVVAHVPGGGTIVRRIVAGGGASVIADLGEGAVNVAIAPNGRAVAWERHGEGIFLMERRGATQRLLGPGSSPRFAPDGGSLLVRDDDGGFSLMRLDGARTDLPGLAAFAACSAGCGS